MKERRLKQFSLCTIVCGLCGLVTSVNNIFSLGIPKWVLVIVSLPALIAAGWLMVIGIRHLMGKE
ncbi:MAG: hypothetical protein E7320_12865 [Clostridiales bacterium]|nr:hypothetical protein [Clostridiales bacterium]